MPNTTIRNKNLDETHAYAPLKQLAHQSIDLKKLLNPERINAYTIQNAPLYFNFATSLVNDAVLKALQALADEQAVTARYTALRSGAIMNASEKRAVRHHQTRAKQNRAFYGEEQRRIALFANRIHTGQLKGYTKKAFKHLVQIGIGGSDLGPRALYLALTRYAQAKNTHKMTASFIANVDPDDAYSVLRSVDFETTLFIVVSKSGTTQETLTNLAYVKQSAMEHGVPESALAQHLVAVTGAGSPMDDNACYLDSFYIDDAIGGRYSSTSAVGGVLLSLAFGPEIFESLLAGASTMDESAAEPNIFQNMALMAALIGVWERNFLGFSAKAVIPYSEALSRFPAHIQQLDCESNGKRVNQYFELITYQTGPVIFGEPGTNGQHSFFQKLHQGSDIIPIQFIGFSHSQSGQDVITFNSSSQKKLNANLTAQIAALALGKSDPNPNKSFGGNRPSSLVYADRLTPDVLGALLAFFENMVMFQGFIWNLNSFDQEGVQLGKVLTTQLLSTKPDPILEALFGIWKV